MSLYVNYHYYPDRVLGEISIYNSNPDFTYMGEGIFNQSNSDFPALYNAKTDQFLNRGIMTPFFDGYAISSRRYENRHRGYGFISVNDLANQETLDNWTNTSSDFSQDVSLYSQKGFGNVDYSIPLLHVDDDYFFIDRNGTRIDIPQFPDGVEIRSFGYFSGGFAPLILEGVDGNAYATIIDRNGEMQYEPVKMEYESIGKYSFPGLNSSLHDFSSSNFGNWTGIFSSDGFIVYIADMAVYIIDTDGNSRQVEYVRVPNIMPAIKIVGDSIRVGNDLRGINGNLIYFGSQIISLDGSINFTDVIVSTYEDGTPVPVESTATSATEYTNVSSFDITGKWKSVGTSGFGQAQPGAIVAFDGTNCNFFSPNDTYAFYSDGDWYTLDTTSVLTAQTISFTVKTIDKDSIDIFYGSDVTSLKRVE